jgi:hypothetical protein
VGSSELPIRSEGQIRTSSTIVNSCPNPNTV